MSTERVKAFREKSEKDGWKRQEYKIRPHWHELILGYIAKLTKREQR